MKISHLIFFSIFFILLLFSITTYVNYKQSEEVRDNAAFLATSSNIVRQTNQFQRNILYMERALKGYVVTTEEYLLQTYDSAYAQNTQLIAELSSSFSSTSTQVKKLEEIKGLYNDWVENVGKPTIELFSSKDFSRKKLQAFLKDEEILNKKLQLEFRDLLNMEYVNRANRRVQLDESEQQTKQISVLLTALSIVIGFIIAILLARYISKRIIKMVNMANSISEGNYKVQVQDKANDELSQLMLSLNHMAKMLELNISLLQRKNRELDQFAHIVSHDLKAPLRGIDNVLSWIEEDHAHELPSKVDEYLQLIRGRVLRSENLIQGILAYARIGKEEDTFESVDLNLLISEIVENVPEREGLTITVQPDLPVIYSERVPLIQIFTNLISNAFKYHDKANGFIKIYCKEDSEKYTFYVEDNGPGIDKNYHHKIFVIFQTLKERDSFESTGVGLAIVKKILDDRNEHINLQSEPGKGSVFSFTWNKKISL